MSYFDLNDYIRIKEHNIQKIKHLSSWVWKTDIDNKKIDNWLENFQGLIDQNKEHEEINSLFLLKQYMYFGQREVREMLKSSYHNLFYKPLLHHLKYTSKIPNHKLATTLESHLAKTRFLGIGNISESSSLLLYYFRQVNKLDPKLFWHVHEVFQYNEDNVLSLTLNENNEKIENYIFIDDISGTGTQAYSFFTGKNREEEIVGLEVIKQIIKKNSNANIYYITLFSTQKSNEKLDKISNLKIKNVFLLDDTYRVFNSKSRYFPLQKKKYEECTKELVDKEKLEELNYSKKISEKYFPSLNLKSYYKYGFRNSQLLLSFFYNTPNNTLPIFWAKNDSWESIFKRYEKVLKE